MRLRGRLSGVSESGVSESWTLEHRRGSAQELHARAVGDPVTGRSVVVNHVSAPALVLGSTQDRSAFDEGFLAASGIDLARRRSGGGAVLLAPRDHVWVDLVVPSGDPLSDDDVERATWWVGEAWAASLERGSVSEVVVHDRGVSDRGRGRIACFAAVGPGEVLVAGRKVLGVSQRRTREGSRFQCVAYRSWDPEPLIRLLVDPAKESRNGPGGTEWGSGEVVGHVVDALRSDAAAALSPDWDVESHLLPVLP